MCCAVPALPARDHAGSLTWRAHAPTRRLHERKLARRRRQAALEAAEAAALREQELSQLSCGAASLASLGSCYSGKTASTTAGLKPLDRRPTAEIRVEVPRLGGTVAPPAPVQVPADFAQKASPALSPGKAPPAEPADDA